MFKFLSIPVLCVLATIFLAQAPGQALAEEVVAENQDADTTEGDTKQASDDTDKKDVKKSASNASQAFPSLQIEVDQANKSIRTPRDIVITLTNPTEKPFNVESVKLILPQSLMDINPQFKSVIEHNNDVILGNDTIVFHIGIPRASILNEERNCTSLQGWLCDLYHVFFDLDTLFFVAGDYIFRTEVILTDGTNETIKKHLNATKKVPLEASLFTILRGGLIGAVLLSLFIPSRKWANTRTVSWSSKFTAMKDMIASFSSLIIPGSVMSVTVIVVIHRIGIANLPVSVSVNDYLGGIIIGLFSFVIGNSLYDKYFKSHDTALEAKVIAAKKAVEQATKKAVAEAIKLVPDNPKVETAAKSVASSAVKAITEIAGNDGKTEAAPEAIEEVLGNNAPSAEGLNQ